MSSEETEQSDSDKTPPRKKALKYYEQKFIDSCLQDERFKGWLKKSAKEVEIDGEVSFNVEVMDKAMERAVDDQNLATENTTAENVTVAAVVECLYQYPDLEQFNAMLSYMMNELTKVFMRAHELMRNEHSEEEDVVQVKEEKLSSVSLITPAASSTATEGQYRYRNGSPKFMRAESRFRVVDKKNTQYFDHIYLNMTQEYKTTQRVQRAQGGDPCQHQEELKEVWRNLLETSLTSLRRAAMKSVDEYLQARNRSDDIRSRYKMGQLVLKELGRIRTNQLSMLCDKFQLCYNDLL